MTTATTTTKNATKTANKTVATQVRKEQEMMIMRETDQWMAEHYGARR